MTDSAIQSFWALLNEAITAGRKPWGRWYTKAYNTIRGSAVYWFERTKWSPIVYPDSYVFDGATNFSLTSILFDTDSWFLDMIEWKTKWWHINGKQGENDYQNSWYYMVDSSDIDYHKIRLAILDSDEKRIKYVLDNMKWLTVDE